MPRSFIKNARMSRSFEKNACPTGHIPYCETAKTMLVSLIAILEEQYYCSDPTGNISDPPFPFRESFSDAIWTVELCQPIQITSNEQLGNWNYPNIPDYSCPKLRRSRRDSPPLHPPSHAGPLEGGSRMVTWGRGVSIQNYSTDILTEGRHE